MDLVIDPLESLPDDHDVEVVERKGLGHQDTLCDAIAERICVRALSQLPGPIRHDPSP